MRVMKIPKRVMMLCCGVSLAFAARALTSSPLVVTLDGDPSTSFWRTAPSGDFTVYWEKPAGATSATLSVTGMGFSREVKDLAGTSCLIDFLPADENVYTFTLTFDNDVERTASVARIATRGAASVADVPIRICAYDSLRWRRTKSACTVLPIPAGTESFAVDGVAKAWSGESGWYGLGPLTAYTTHTLELGGVSRSVAYLPIDGLMLIIR